MKLLIFSVGFLCVQAQTIGPVLTAYDHFSKKAIYDDTIITGGLLVTRDFQYLAAQGVKSIVAMFQVNASNEWQGVPGDYPSSDQEKELAESLNMTYVGFDIQNPFSPDAVNEVSGVLTALPKPLYLHCHDGYGAGLYSQLHLVLTGANEPSSFYNYSLKMGWDYQSNADTVALVAATIDVDVPVMPPSIELDLANGESSYPYFYWVHRLANMDGWYNTGQILDTQVEAIITAGYKTVISFRADGEPTVRLPSDPATGAVDNHEFSDENGNWSADFEQQAFTDAGLNWINLPVTGDTAYTVSDLDAASPSLAAAFASGPVLVHCASGYRSAVYVLAYQARLDGKCTDWAVQRAREVGYTIDAQSSGVQAYNFFMDVLGC